MDRISKILSEVADQFNISVNDLRGRSRMRHIARPRQFCYLRLRDETEFSYPLIARVMGDRDHTTIIFGINAVRKRIKNGEEC